MKERNSILPIETVFIVDGKVNGEEIG